MKDVEKKFILNNLTAALRPGSFADSLYAESSLTMGELQNRATKFICIEEMWAFQKSQREEAAQVGNPNHERKEGKRLVSYNERKDSSGQQDFPRGPKFTNYTL